MFELEDFADYTRLDVGDIDTGFLEQLKREARMLIRQSAPHLDADDDAWPEEAKIVALRVVARGYLKPTGDNPLYGASSVSHGAGPFSQSINFTTDANQPGLWLTKADLRALGAHKGGAYTVDLAPRVFRNTERGPDWWRTL